MLDCEGLMELAWKKAKEEVALLYPEGDARRKKKEDELKNEYYRRYTTPPHLRAGA